MLAQTRNGNGQGDGFEGPEPLMTIYLEQTRIFAQYFPEEEEKKVKAHEGEATGTERKDP